jgi:hypothetical protein
MKASLGRTYVCFKATCRLPVQLNVGNLLDKFMYLLRDLPFYSNVIERLDVFFPEPWNLQVTLYYRLSHTDTKGLPTN